MTFRINIKTFFYLNKHFYFKHVAFFSLENIIGLFQTTNCNRPVEDINGKFQGQSRSRWNSRGVTKSGGKKMVFLGESMQKNWISRGVTVNLIGNPGGSTSKKAISSTQGILYLKTSFIYTLRRLMNSDRTCEPGQNEGDRFSFRTQTARYRSFSLILDSISFSHLVSN